MVLTANFHCNGCLVENSCWITVLFVCQWGPNKWYGGIGQNLKFFYIKFPKKKPTIIAIAQWQNFHSRGETLCMEVHGSKPIIFISTTIDHPINCWVETPS